MILDGGWKDWKFLDMRLQRSIICIEWLGDKEKGVWTYNPYMRMFLSGKVASSL